MRTKLGQWSASGIGSFDPDAVEAYVDAFSDPASIAEKMAVLERSC